MARNKPPEHAQAKALGQGGLLRNGLEGVHLVPGPVSEGLGTPSTPRP